MTTHEQKEKIKAYALQGKKPKEIKELIPGLSWDNKRISNWLRERGIREKCVKIREKVQEKIEQKIIEKKVSEFEKYQVTDAWENFEQIRKLALVPNGETGRLDLTNAIKAEENKSKLKGLYEADNKQKNAGEALTKNVADLEAYDRIIKRITEGKVGDT
jgi:hypothetical protein